MTTIRDARGRFPSVLRRLAVGGALAFGWPAQTPAQTREPTIRGLIAPDDVPDPAVEKRAQRDARQGELEAVERALRANEEAKARLAAELADLRTDQAKLRAALIRAAEDARSAEERLGDTERRLDRLVADESALKRSLAQRRETIVEVLATLQRMGRKPPPAMMVRADDMLDAVRAAMMLGGLLPHLRSEAETLAGDLTELVRLRTAIAAERNTLSSDIGALASERARLAGLVEARRARIGESERDAAEEAKRTRELAARSRTLRDLLHKLESELGVAADALERARKEAEALATRTRQRLASAALREPTRLEVKIAFGDAKGRLPSPVVGPIVRGFGAPEPGGDRSRGLTIAARPGTTVIAPADGKVEFAGPFRTFGQVLIVNAGGGYYIVLSGLASVDVEVGQFILAGEPVARLGAAEKEDDAGALLYVELRKDGQSIDPLPWWPQVVKEKVRG